MAQHTRGIRTWVDPRVIALEGFDTSLGHTVGLRAFDLRRAGDQADLAGSGGRAVVGQLFDRRRQPAHEPEAPLDALYYQVADVAAVNACGRGDSRNRLAVAAIQDEGDAYPFAVVAADLKPIRTPARIGPIDRDADVMPPVQTIAIAIAAAGGDTLRPRGREWVLEALLAARSPNRRLSCREPPIQTDVTRSAESPY